MTEGSVVAVDLGASSGRVVVGAFGGGGLEVREVHRFVNEPVVRPDGLHWDVDRQFREILDGLGAAARLAPTPVRSVAIDTWGVDFGLVGQDGALTGEPFHYRDERNARGVERVHARISREALYARTGIQFLPFNTVYQLAAAQGTPAFQAAARCLLMPDLFGAWLADVRCAELTNASTTSLLDATSGTWATDLCDLLDIPASLLPPLVPPGQLLGPLRRDVLKRTGLPAGTLLTSAPSHDTASAVAAIPAEGPDVAYISCGTWSLVGVEIEHPILTKESLLANFTNERGVDGRIRYLTNVMGLWILQETLRTWQEAGTPEDLAEILGAAASLPAGGPTVDPNDPLFLPPGDMPNRLLEAFSASGQSVPETRPALVRAILDSLAAAYARAVENARRLSRKEVRVIHLVGGGSRNALLCQLTADATGLRVAAGPVETTALGNLLVQARAHGLVSGTLEELRRLMRRTNELRWYEPRTGQRPVSG